MFVDVHEVLAANDLEASGCLDGIQVLQQRPGRLVARVDTVTGPVVIKASAQPGAFVTEEAAIHRLAGHGLPVASVIGHRVGPPSYLVLTWTDGSSLTARSPARAQRTFGELLRRVHTIGAEPGRDDLSFPDNTTWDGWMTGWLNTALTWWSSVDPLGERRTRQAWDWFHRLAPLLANRGQDLILFDGRPEHILVRDDDIAGLIDVAELRTGDAAMDLGVLAVADPAILTEVLAGYRPSDDERDAFSRLVPFYTFLRAISSAVWHQSFGTADELTRALHRIASMDIPA